ncbi:MAG: NAD(P)/FAD-dependent oxidoreductase [Verrucomicrobia bacterium]|nr:NAD(P)/FAD-dependent oxidoreductase [Verrucomicrobiota bacterium]
MKYDAIIVGGGAAGLFCALTAGQRGRRVLVLEHSESVGEKIKISGGGRCNFTNIHAGPENYLSENPAFCRSALARFSPWDFIALVEKHGIAYHEKKLGQQFCDGSSREIISMLLSECSDARVEIRSGCRVEEVRPGFSLKTSRGDLECDSIVIATGSLSFAKLGASDFGHRIARQFGMRVTALRPGLVPLTLKEQDLRVFGPVSGASLPVRVRNAGASFEEALLVTHRGFSGPAILQISSHWKSGDAPVFDLLPGGAVSFRPGATSAPAFFSEFWPRRFADAWCSLHAPQKPLNHWSDRERREVLNLAHNWPVAFSGTEGYSKAEVTLGGVDTAGLSSKTMESRSVRGLYFIGEVVDVTGWLGGYNFQWAWASAHAAGESI